MSNKEEHIEEWKEVKGYEGLYEVSNIGRIKSLTRKAKCLNGFRITKERILKNSVKSGGYYTVSLWCNGKRKTKSVHKLVSDAHIINPENKTQVNHKDGNKTNNTVENLEWCTPRENCEHAVMCGLTTNNHTKKKIVQIKDGEIINVWDSAADAGRTLSIRRSTITSVCTGKLKSYYGFKWKHA